MKADVERLGRDDSRRAWRHGGACMLGYDSGRSSVMLVFEAVAYFSTCCGMASGNGCKGRSYVRCLWFGSGVSDSSSSLAK